MKISEIIMHDTRLDFNYIKPCKKALSQFIPPWWFQNVQHLYKSLMVLKISLIMGVRTYLSFTFTFTSSRSCNKSWIILNPMKHPHIMLSLATYNEITTPDILAHYNAFNLPQLWDLECFNRLKVINLNWFIE